MVGYTSSFGLGSAFYPDVYLIKTDANGDTLWTKTYGGSYGDEGYSVQQTTDGGYIIVGRTFSFGLGTSTSPDVYLIKTDMNGDTLWTKTYGGTNHDRGNFVQQTVDGGYIITGITVSFGTGGENVYLIRTNATGDTLWTKTYGGTDTQQTNTDRGHSVEQTSDGGFIITGSATFGERGAYLIKTDSNGDTLWTKSYGGIGVDDGSSVKQTADGGYIIMGFTVNFGAGGRDVYLIKTDANGDTLWTKTYGGTGDDETSNLLEAQQTVDGGYIITGRTNSFGAGNYDVYLIKTDANGNSGCNELSTATIVSNTSMQIGFGATIGSGAIVNNTATIISSAATIDYALCDTCLVPVGAFSYSLDTLNVNFFDLSTGATSFYWDFGDGFNDTIQNPVHTYDSMGTYNVCLIATNICGSDTLCDSINLICTPPTANFTYSSSLLTVNFTDSSTGATSWFWEFGVGGGVMIQNPTFTFDSAGTYNVCLTAGNACGSNTVCDSVTVIITSVQDHGLVNDIKVFPNPNTGEFIIVFYLQNITDVDLKILNIIGEVVYAETLSSIQDSYQKHLDLNGFVKGIYILELITNKGIINKKIIIE